MELSVHKPAATSNRGAALLVGYTVHTRSCRDGDLPWIANIVSLVSVAVAAGRAKEVRSTAQHRSK